MVFTQICNIYFTCTGNLEAVFIFCHHQRLEEIMKRTRRSDTAEKVKAIRNIAHIQ